MEVEWADALLSLSLSLSQVHSGCRDTLEMNQRDCTYRDLWHMILLPKAIAYRHSIRSGMDIQGAGRPGEGIQGAYLEGRGGIKEVYMKEVGEGGSIDREDRWSL